MLARVFMLASLVLSLVAQAAAPVPEPKIVQGESCVEPTDVMRRNHMVMLMHQRDDTVMDGIRTHKHSLAGCVECHADTDSDGKYIPVNAPGQFCSTCHEYAAVKLDCFSCHATVPANPDENASVEPDQRDFASTEPASGLATLRSMMAGGAQRE